MSDHVRPQRAWRAFAFDRRGNVASMFAFSVIPIMAAVGAAVDFANHGQVKAELDRAADAAALAGAVAAKKALDAGQNGWVATGVDAASRTFAANVGSVPGVTYDPPDIRINRSSGSVQTRIAYQAQVATQLGRVIGISSLRARRTVEASAGADSKFYQLSLAFDVSPSMGIAANTAEIARLQSLTGGCAFACHDSDDPAQPSYLTIARNNGVTLRIDDAKTAARSLTTLIAQGAARPNQYRVGLYGISWRAQMLQAATASMTTAATAIDAVTFDRMSSVAPMLPSPAASYMATGTIASHYADSDFARSLADLDAVVPANGDGHAANAPQQIVLLLTDGVNDVGRAFNSAISATYAYPASPSYLSGNDAGKLTSPFDPAACANLKARGVTVAVLYTPYTETPGDYWYGALVASNAPPAAVRAGLKACASRDSLFYEATDVNSITTGLATLFSDAANMATPRLTN